MTADLQLRFVLDWKHDVSTYSSTNEILKSLSDIIPCPHVLMLFLTPDKYWKQVSYFNYFGSIKTLWFYHFFQTCAFILRCGNTIL